uniref:GTP-binding protein LepA C-terminal domain-containing protein n=1 Tax=Physcomitrium patens TaxID=3218 RepID=A0A2K1L4E5_PHYPA|nr:hypothetical protein PHYPA_003689 [Physcomitrium patens]
MGVVSNCGGHGYPLIRIRLHYPPVFYFQRALIESPGFCLAGSSDSDSILVHHYGGGDVSRQRELLDNQNEGKEQMKRVVTLDVSQKAIHLLFKNSN